MSGNSSKDKEQTAPSLATPNPLEISLNHDILDISVLSDSIEPEAEFLKKLSEPLKNSRDRFLQALNTLVDFETGDKTGPLETRDERAKRRRNLFLSVYRELKVYTYHRYQDELAKTDGITKESCAKTAVELQNQIKELGGDPHELTRLLSDFTTVHKKDLQFRSKLVTTLQQELLYLQIGNSLLIEDLNNIQKDIEKKNEKKLDRLRRDLHKKLADAQLANEKLNEELETFREENKNQDLRIQDLISQTESKCPETTEDNKQFLAQISDLELKNKTARKEYDNLLIEKTSAEDNLTEAEKQIKTLDFELEIAQNSLDRFEDQIVRLQEDLKDEKENSSEKYDEYIQEHQKNNALVKTLADKTSEFNDRVTDLTNERNSIQQQLQYVQDQLDQNNAAYTSDIQTLQNSITILTDESAEKAGKSFNYKTN